MPDLPFGVRSYQSRSLPFSSQQMVNCYVEGGNSGTKSNVLVVGTPGTIDFATAGTAVRGMAVMAGILYVVSGTSLYSVSSSGTATSLGTIPGAGPVSIDNSDTQLCVVAGGNGYVYNNSTATFAQITDVDFPGADSVTFINDYFIFNLGSRLFNSDLGDATRFNALSFANDDYAPDDALRVFADHSELWVFSSDSTVPWYNAGGSFFPFLPRQGVALEVGILSKFSVAKLAETVFWLGVDKRGGRKIYQKNGYGAIPISTPAICKRLDEFDAPETAIGFAYSQEQHDFYVLVLPGFATLVYDVTTKEFHERRSWTREDWRMGSFAYCYGKRLVGDRLTGNIYELDLDTYTENGGIIERIMTSGTIATQDGKWARHKRVEIDFDTGVGNAADNNPECSLAWVNDGAQDFTNYRSRSLGGIGEYTKRVYWNSLGKARSRIYRLRMTDANKFHVKGAYYFIGGQ